MHFVHVLRLQLYISTPLSGFTEECGHHQPSLGTLTAQLFFFSFFFKGTQLFAAKDCGADPTVQDSSGYTAFQLAVLKDPTSKAKES